MITILSFAARDPKQCGGSKGIIYLNVVGDDDDGGDDHDDDGHHGDEKRKDHCHPNLMLTMSRQVERQALKSYT